MIRSAMGTKILMRPTKQEGMLLWSTDKMEALPERRYAQGDAWISSTDGIMIIRLLCNFLRWNFRNLKYSGRYCIAITIKPLRPPGDSRRMQPLPVYPAAGQKHSMEQFI